MRLMGSDGATCTRIGLLVNILLTVLKLAAGILGRSQAMIADALHSFSDVVATGGVYIGFKIAERPADRNHPFGHGNADTLAAIFVAIILLLTGIYIGGQAFHIIVHEAYDEPTSVALWAAVLSIVVKELLFRYTLKVGRRLNSRAIVANAYDHRSDAYSSVAAFIGIVGAKLGLILLDPIAGFVIAGLIVRMAFHLMKTNVNILMDGMPEGTVVTEVLDTAGRVEGVVGTRGTRIHPVGPGNIVDIKILVDRHLSVEEGHRIASQVKEVLIAEHGHIRDVIVHVEPDNRTDTSEGRA
ncbi:MAG: cation transporter [Gemmatimonadota bacterium]|nr:MAG: cation transporter [Gemmatimonadota bacterium]